MSRILVSGLVNVETTVKVKEFPINYCPIEFSSFGVASGVSGVGYNLGKAFSSLGDEIKVASIIGNDMFERVICDEFMGADLDTDYLMKGLDQTPQSVIIYETSGRRQCHCDLKDIQDKVYVNSNLNLDDYDLHFFFFYPAFLFTSHLPLFKHGTHGNRFIKYKMLIIT
ncbi:MAG TPA: hypothetical protein VHQ24_01335 [Lachnospiraceae bacterium]|nr:hypothetical protein [Lachnospiraceae bacterium]